MNSPAPERGSETLSKALRKIRACLWYLETEEPEAWELLHTLPEKKDPTALEQAMQLMRENILVPRPLEGASGSMDWPLETEFMEKRIQPWKRHKQREGKSWKTKRPKRSLKGRHKRR